MSTSPPTGRGVTMVGAPSVRELITELAGIEDTLRAIRAPHPPPAEPAEDHQRAGGHLDPGLAGEPSVPAQRVLVHRQRQIAAELRRHRHQWRAAVVAGPRGVGKESVRPQATPPSPAS